MNLLIPTNDGISIATNFDDTHKFRLLSIINGSVAVDEIRDFKNGIENEFLTDNGIHPVALSGKGGISSPETKNEDSKLHYIILAKSISEKSEKKLCEMNFEVLLTKETNITNAIIYFLKYQTTHESDYCCCP